MNRPFMILKKKLTPGAMTIIVNQVYWYISQISSERLQDHWSSGSFTLEKKSTSIL